MAETGYVHVKRVSGMLVAGWLAGLLAGFQTSNGTVI